MPLRSILTDAIGVDIAETDAVQVDIIGSNAVPSRVIGWDINTHIIGDTDTPPYSRATDAVDPHHCI